jgi:hypothetical protein
MDSRLTDTLAKRNARRLGVRRVCLSHRIVKEQEQSNRFGPFPWLFVVGRSLGRCNPSFWLPGFPEQSARFQEPLILCNTVPRTALECPRNDRPDCLGRFYLFGPSARPRAC